MKDFTRGVAQGALLTILGFAICAMFITLAGAEEPATCVLAGVNDDGGWIACGEYDGPARIVERRSGGHPYDELRLLVADELAIDARVYSNPDGSVFAVVLYDAGGIFAFGITRSIGGVESQAIATWLDVLDFAAPCTDFAGPHWCR